MKFIYQPGQINPHATTYTRLQKDGTPYKEEYVEFVSSCLEFPTPPTVSEYLAVLNSRREPNSPEFIVCDYEKLKKLMCKAQDEKFIKPWVEITEEEFNEALEVLPPEKWLTVNGVNLFRMCEYYTENLTDHYARLGGKYLKAMRRTTHKYEDLAKEVYEASKG